MYYSEWKICDSPSSLLQIIVLIIEITLCGGGRLITGILRLRPGCKAGLVQSHASDSKL